MRLLTSILLMAISQGNISCSQETAEQRQQQPVSKNGSNEPVSSNDSDAKRDSSVEDEEKDDLIEQKYVALTLMDLGGAWAGECVADQEGTIFYKTVLASAFDFVSTTTSNYSDSECEVLIEESDPRVYTIISALGAIDEKSSTVFDIEFSAVNPETGLEETIESQLVFRIDGADLIYQPVRNIISDLDGEGAESLSKSLDRMPATAAYKKQ